MKVKNYCGEDPPPILPRGGMMGRMQRVMSHLRAWFVRLAGETCDLTEAIAELRQNQAAQEMLAEHRQWVRERAAAELLAHGLATSDGQRFRCPVPTETH